MSTFGEAHPKAEGEVDFYDDHDEEVRQLFERAVANATGTQGFFGPGILSLASPILS
jgi:hypothetical protein